MPVRIGAIARSGGLGVMRQFIGMIGDDSTLADLALSLAPPADLPITIEAARLEWLETEERIEASGNVRITYGADRLTADRIVADLRLDEVLAEITPQEEQ